MIKYSGIILFLLCLAISGCDNALDPLDEEKGNFSIHGYLNLDKKANYIRVKDLNTTYRQDSTGKIDADVTFENLKTGETQTLEDTVVEFDGIKTHNFRTTMDIRPDTKYKVTVEDSVGQTTSATATTPFRAERKIEPKIPNCTTRVNINFEPARSQFGFLLEVAFEYKNDLFWLQMNEYLLDSDSGVTASFEPWTVLKKIFEAEPPTLNDIYEEGEVFCHQLSSDIYKVRYTHYGPGLYENTISDTLAIPGGAGRFGALYRDDFSFRIDTTELCPPLSPIQCI